MLVEYTGNFHDRFCNWFFFLSRIKTLEKSFVFLNEENVIKLQNSLKKVKWMRRGNSASGRTDCMIDRWGNMKEWNGADEWKKSRGEWWGNMRRGCSTIIRNDRSAAVFGEFGRVLKSRLSEPNYHYLHRRYHHLSEVDLRTFGRLWVVFICFSFSNHSFVLFLPFFLNIFSFLSLLYASFFL